MGKPHRFEIASAFGANGHHPLALFNNGKLTGLANPRNACEAAHVVMSWFGETSMSWGAALRLMIQATAEITEHNARLSGFIPRLVVIEARGGRTVVMREPMRQEVVR